MFGYPATVACSRVPLESLPWSQGAHPLERKKVGGVLNVALLEFAPGFDDRNWCRRGHALYVLSGALTFEVDAGIVQVAEGESCVIDAGTAHRARNDGHQPVRVFIYSFE
jgi:quercetin dioxygenase-like cupin family protein